MSWGFFADLRLSLPDDTWELLRDRKPAAIRLEPGWSGLQDVELEAAFGAPNTSDETFAKVLRWKCYTGDQAISSVTSSENRTDLRVALLLDKSQLDLAFPLAALLSAARESGGEGSLKLVNDGTYGGEDGVELTLSDGVIAAAAVEDCWKIVATLGAEVFGGELYDEGEALESPKDAGNKPMIDPVTGKAVGAAKKKTAAKRNTAPAKKTAAKKKTAK